MAQTATSGTASAESSVANNVRAEMARRRVSGRDLATALRWSERTARRRLAGELPFTVDELTAVAGHLQVPITALLPPTP